jgi:hypothetical protein
MVDRVPSMEEFERTVRDAFAFLARDFAFREGARASKYEPFSVRFVGPGVAVVVVGEGYGTKSDVRLENERGDTLSFIWLVPPAARPVGKGRATQVDQLSSIRDHAEAVARHCADFLTGDTGRFERAVVERHRLVPSSR